MPIETKSVDTSHAQSSLKTYCGTDFGAACLAVHRQISPEAAAYVTHNALNFSATTDIGKRRDRAAHFGYLNLTAELSECGAIDPNPCSTFYINSRTGETYHYYDRRLIATIKRGETVKHHVRGDISRGVCESSQSVLSPKHRVYTHELAAGYYDKEIDVLAKKTPNNRSQIEFAASLVREYTYQALCARNVDTNGKLIRDSILKNEKDQDYAINLIQDQVARLSGGNQLTRSQLLQWIGFSIRTPGLLDIHTDLDLNPLEEKLKAEIDRIRKTPKPATNFLDPNFVENMSRRVNIDYIWVSGESSLFDDKGRDVVRDLLRATAYTDYVKSGMVLLTDGANAVYDTGIPDFPKTTLTNTAASPYSKGHIAALTDKHDIVHILRYVKYTEIDQSGFTNNANRWIEIGTLKLERTYHKVGEDTSPGDWQETRTLKYAQTDGASRHVFYSADLYAKHAYPGNYEVIAGNQVTLNSPSEKTPMLEISSSDFAPIRVVTEDS